MPKNRKKKPKTGGPAPKKPRNPFAGKPQSGAGYHSEAKYGKRDRREEKQELEEEQVPEEDVDRKKEPGPAKETGSN